MLWVRRFRRPIRRNHVLVQQFDEITPIGLSLSLSSISGVGLSLSAGKHASDRAGGRTSVGERSARAAVNFLAPPNTIYRIHQAICTHQEASSSSSLQLHHATSRLYVEGFSRLYEWPRQALTPGGEERTNLGSVKWRG